MSRCEHAGGVAIALGSGMLRRACVTCGNVEIDLRGVVAESRHEDPRVSDFMVRWAEN